MSSSDGNGAGVAKLTSDATTAPVTKMSVYEAIYQRRMAWQYKDDPVPRETMGRLLEAAIWVPNHRLTEPWRFFVTEKDTPTRQKVADLAYEHQMGRFDNPTRAEATRQVVLAPPLVVYVYCVPGPNEEATQENYASVICAAYNMALAGFAEGLTVTFETGGATKHPKLGEALGAEEDWSLVTMLSIGVPGESIVTRRSPVHQFVSWLP